jgi:hypothetical protein
MNTRLKVYKDYQGTECVLIPTYLFVRLPNNRILLLINNNNNNDNKKKKKNANTPNCEGD